MDVSLNDLRAFAVRNRVDVVFQVQATEAAWMVNRRGLVARPPVGDPTRAGVEETLAVADVFVIAGEKDARQRLTRAQLIELLAAKAAATGARKDRDDE
jgi:hypothetical protein